MRRSLIVVPDDDPPHFDAYPDALERLRGLGSLRVYGSRTGDVDELAARLEGAEVVLNVRAYTRFDERLLVALPALRLISVLGTGTDNVDPAACDRLGIAIANAPGASAVSIAEMTLALLLAVARQVARSDRDLRRGLWRHHAAIELRDRVLGVVGLGRVGGEVARLGRALGMRVVAWSFSDDPERARVLGVELLPLDDLLANADAVSIHLRASPRSQGLIGEREIGLMKPSALLVNTARAALVDEEALLAALRANRIAGAGLDVFAREPLPPDSPWLQLENAVLTPHAAGVTPEASARLTALTVDNIADYLAGKPANIVNPEALRHPRQLRRD